MSFGSRFFSLFFLAVVALVLGGLLVLGIFVGTIGRPVGVDSQVNSFIIARGERVQDIADHLAAQGYISNALAFKGYLWMKGWGSHLQAGEYKLTKNLTIREVAEQLTSGRGAPEQSITIIEGWTIDDIATYLDHEGVVDASDFKEAANRLSSQQLFSVTADKPANASLEGYLFPDTYRILRGSSSDEIILKMLVNSDRKLTPEIRAQAKARGVTVFELLTMASIVEREGRKPADLALIADLFYRRLAIGMALQSDATLNYVLPKDQRKPALTATDLKNTSLYNTYKYKGLPPGPIGNSGLNAIRAAVAPTANDYWYFLHAPDGTTIFAKTLAEQNQHKQQYLK